MTTVKDIIRRRSDRLFSPRSTKDGFRLAALLAFSLVTKLILGFLVCFRNPSAVWHPDSASYHNIAINLLRHGVFSRSAGPPFVYESFRTPGYPLVLAGAYALFGTSPLPVIILQAVVATGVVAITWFVGRELFGPRVGTYAAALLCLDVSCICSGQMLMSETTFTLLLLIGIWLLARSLRPVRTPASFVLSGLTLALAVHIRPIAYYLVPLATLGIILFLLASDRNVVPRLVRWRLALSRAGAFLLLPVLLLGGWQLNNLHHTGVAQFCPIEGFNMYFYRAAGMVSIRDHKAISEVHRALGFETQRSDFSGWVARHPECQGQNPAVLSGRWFREGFNFILHHPGLFILMHLRSTAAFLLDPGTFGFATLLGLESDDRGQELMAVVQTSPGACPSYLWSQHRAFFLLSLLGLALLTTLYAGIAIWLRRARRSDWTAGVVALGLTVVYFVAISAGPEAAARFRVPVAPLLALFAAAGWLHGTRPRRHRAPSSSTPSTGRFPD